MIFLEMFQKLKQSYPSLGKNLPFAAHLIAAVAAQYFKWTSAPCFTMMAAASLLGRYSFKIISKALPMISLSMTKKMDFFPYYLYITYLIAMIAAVLLTKLSLHLALISSFVVALYGGYFCMNNDSFDMNGLNNSTIIVY